MLALVRAVQKWHSYLLEAEFAIFVEINNYYGCSKKIIGEALKVWFSNSLQKKEGNFSYRCSFSKIKNSSMCYLLLFLVGWVPWNPKLFLTLTRKIWWWKSRNEKHWDHGYLRDNWFLLRSYLPISYIRNDYSYNQWIPFQQLWKAL